MDIDDTMQLRLSCYCCGSTDFKHTGMTGLINIENKSYLPFDSITDNKVICNKCGLEDYIENLVIKFA